MTRNTGTVRSRWKWAVESVFLVRWRKRLLADKGFAALQVPVSASPSSEPVKLSRS